MIAWYVGVILFVAGIVVGILEMAICSGRLDERKKDR